LFEKDTKKHCCATFYCFTAKSGKIGHKCQFFVKKGNYLCDRAADDNDTAQLDIIELGTGPRRLFCGHKSVMVASLL